MSKPRLYKIGGGVVAFCFAIASVALPETGWLTPELSRWAFLLAIVGIIIGGLLWFIGIRYKVEDRQLVRTIPQIINDMHIQRGQTTNKYIQESLKTGELSDIQRMIDGLNRYLGGVEIPKTIDSMEAVFDAIGKVFESLPKTQDVAKEISDYELARLIAESAKTHLPIEDRLNKIKSFNKLEKSLKTAREKLPKGIAEDASKSIDYYLTYSKGYWALSISIAYVTESLKGIEPLAQTAYNLYINKFQEQMNRNLAKVCEVINEYGK